MVLNNGKRSPSQNPSCRLRHYLLHSNHATRASTPCLRCVPWMPNSYWYFIVLAAYYTVSFLCATQVKLDCMLYAYHVDMHGNFLLSFLPCIYPCVFLAVLLYHSCLYSMLIYASFNSILWTHFLAIPVVITYSQIIVIRCMKKSTSTVLCDGMIYNFTYIFLFFHGR